MAHGAQIDFCNWARSLRPDFFINARVIDVGSLDINGNNRQFFTSPNSYIGVDIVQGNNVDIVGKAHEVLPTLPVADIVVSTEMLEHDIHWPESMRAMYSVVRPGGLIMITAAGDCRHEHGTHNHTPQDSPGTLGYYENISNRMLGSILKPEMFKEYFVRQVPCDIQFYGIKI